MSEGQKGNGKAVTTATEENAKCKTQNIIKNKNRKEENIKCQSVTNTYPGMNTLWE